MNDRLTHIDSDGRARMVDISEKAVTAREARARGSIRMSQGAYNAAMSGGIKKGDPRAVAELAGIMAAKRTADIIPLCHPIALSGVKVEIEAAPDLPGFHVLARVKTAGRTGVEMEALSAVSIACLTLYDMLKAVDKSMRIEAIELVEKTGGKSGPWQRPASDAS